MAMKPKKMRGGGSVKKMRGGGGVKKMRGGGMAMKPQPMKKGGTDLATIRKMAKDKGYKLVKA
jgi:hypothetical protein